MVTQWQRRLGQLVGKWRRRNGGGAQSGADGYRSNMLLLLFLSVPLLTTGLVGSEEVSVDTDECLRGAKASHGDNPNDELDSFLACVLARLDAVSFPCSRLLVSM